MTTPKAEPIDWQSMCLLAERQRDAWIQRRDEAVDASFKMQARAEQAEAALKEALEDHNREHENFHAGSDHWTRKAMTLSVPVSTPTKDDVDV